MRITKISAWQVDLPLVDGRYEWSHGNFVEVFDSTVVEIQTDTGECGYGECCPLGSAYLPAYAAGVRAGLKELAPKLIGVDPRAIDLINRSMDQMLRGHPYVKSAIDMACWDVVGRATGMPVYLLLGGAQMSEIPLYRAIGQRSPGQMADSVHKYRDQGYHKFQLKVGSHPDADIERIRAAAAELQAGDVLVADANTGWTLHEAARVCNVVRDMDIYIEQPCATYEECLTVRRRTSLPFVLDEVVTDIHVLTRLIGDSAADVINLKISRVGGLTRARQMRDLCAACGVAMTIEDSWGGDIVTAAIAHLAQSTPSEAHFASTDFNSYGTLSLAAGAPHRSGGTMHASPEPGLGVTPHFDVLGDPVMVITG